MYDIAILGGGPAGYTAAQRLGQSGRRVLLLEKAELGGVCLNVGCIPTKTLLHCAKLYSHAKEGAKYGIKTEALSYDYSVMRERKADVIAKLRSGVAAQLRGAKVEIVAGEGRLLARDRIGVSGAAGGELEYSARAVLVATGSSPLTPPIPGAKDNPLVLDSTGILRLEEPPKRLCVIGGGVIGVEFAGLFSALGSDVTVIEMMDEIVPFMDADIAPLLRRALKPVEFLLGHRVDKIEGASVFYTDKTGAPGTIHADLVLMAAGRRPNSTGWGAQDIGLDISPSGVRTDDRMRTNLSGVWAAGDSTGRSLLAHSAYRMAEVAAADIQATLANQEGGGESASERMRYTAIPWVVYGLTEAAGVGLNEAEASAAGYQVKTALVPMKLSGRFAAERGFAAPGAVKLIAEKENGRAGRLLGLHALGPYASEFVWGGAAAIEMELRAADLKQIIFPHPTVCELIRDAAWSLD